MFLSSLQKFHSWYYVLYTLVSALWLCRRLWGQNYEFQLCWRVVNSRYSHLHKGTFTMVQWFMILLILTAHIQVRCHHWGVQLFLLCNGITRWTADISVIHTASNIQFNLTSRAKWTHKRLTDSIYMHSFHGPNKNVYIKIVTWKLNKGTFCIDIIELIMCWA
mgnify:CR=1 FL=1